MPLHGAPSERYNIVRLLHGIKKDISKHIKYDIVIEPDKAIMVKIDILSKLI
jgi:hypothetical protein